MNNSNNLDKILTKYQTSFNQKIYPENNNDSDILMDVFGISPELKRENPQYWGRELGKCWERLVIETCKHSENFLPALRIDDDEPCDLRMSNFAIDTKYRVGSGDSGTLKKFKQYGELLRNDGYTPVFLFLREDNLPAAVTACQNSGWTLYFGEQSFDFIEKTSGFDLKGYLINQRQNFVVNR